MPIPPDPLPAEVQAALRNGNKIEAIKLLRDATGLGLKEAKDIVDGQPPVGQQQPVPDRAHGAPALPPDVLAALQRGEGIQAIRLMRERTGLGLKEAKDAVDAYTARSGGAALGLAPGQVPPAPSRTFIRVAVVVVLVGCGLYLLLRGGG